MLLCQPSLSKRPYLKVPRASPKCDGMPANMCIGDKTMGVICVASVEFDPKGNGSSFVFSKVDGFKIDELPLNTATLQSTSLEVQSLPQKSSFSPLPSSQSSPGSTMPLPHTERGPPSSMIQLTVDEKTWSSSALGRNVGPPERVMPSGKQAVMRCFLGMRYSFRG